MPGLVISSSVRSVEWLVTFATRRSDPAVPSKDDRPRKAFFALAAAFVVVLKKKITSLFLNLFLVGRTFSVVSSHTILEEYSCGQQDIEYNATLRGGQYAGIFRDQGPVKNMQECMHVCCKSKKCDVAMMHGSKCFSVQCLNDTTCETIPADDEDIDIQVAHMKREGTNQLSKFII